MTDAVWKSRMNQQIAFKHALKVTKMWWQPVYNSQRFFPISDISIVFRAVYNSCLSLVDNIYGPRAFSYTSNQRTSLQQYVVLITHNCCCSDIEKYCLDDPSRRDFNRKMYSHKWCVPFNKSQNNICMFFILKITS